MPPRLTAPTVVGDHGHAGLERVGPAVERLELLAGLGEAQAQIAPELSRIEHMQRPAEIHGHQIGDVHERRDRAQADRAQALLQPCRARSVAHAAEHPADEQGTGRRLALRKIERDLKRGIKGRSYWIEITPDHLTESGCRKLSRDPDHAKAVAAVRGHGDIDHRPFDADHLVDAAADRRIRRQLDDPGVILAEQKLARRAQHAATVDAADLRLLQRARRSRGSRCRPRRTPPSCRRARWARRTPPRPGRSPCRPRTGSAARHSDGGAPRRPRRP